MKRSISTLMIFTLLLFLISCGGNQESEESTDAQSLEEEVAEEAEKAKEEIAEVMGGEPGENRVLTDEDLERFKETFYPMSQEFEELGMEMGRDQGEEMNLAETFKSDEVMAILNKYGWDETYGQKYMSILMGFGYLSMQENLESLSEEQRKQYEAALSEQMKGYADMIHEDDMALIKNHMEDLKEVFQQVE